MTDKLSSRNPITQEIVGTVPLTTDEELKFILERSKKGQKKWSNLSVADRAGGAETVQPLSLAPRSRLWRCGPTAADPPTCDRRRHYRRHARPADGLRRPRDRQPVVRRLPRAGRGGSDARHGIST